MSNTPPIIGEKIDIWKEYTRLTEELESTKAYNRALTNQRSAADYRSNILHHRLKLTQGFALMALGYAIITTIAIAILLLKP